MMSVSRELTMDLWSDLW